MGKVGGVGSQSISTQTQKGTHGSPLCRRDHTPGEGGGTSERPVLHTPSEEVAAESWARAGDGQEGPPRTPRTSETAS